jgi:hypothetical protein
MKWFGSHFMWENRACLLGRTNVLEIGEEDVRERVSERTNERKLGPWKSQKTTKRSFPLSVSDVVMGGRKGTIGNAFS